MFLFRSFCSKARKIANASKDFPACVDAGKLGGTQSTSPGVRASTEDLVPFSHSLPPNCLSASAVFFLLASMDSCRFVSCTCALLHQRTSETNPRVGSSGPC